MKSILVVFFTLFSFYNCIESDDGFLPILGVSDMNIFNIVGNKCMSYCGSGNCEAYSTGLKNGGYNPGRIQQCNAQGYFCTATSCLFCCMDKSPNTKILSFEYGKPSAQITVPNAIFTHYIDNYGITKQSGTFHFSETIDNSYSWEYSTSLTTSLELKVQAGLPEIFAIHDTITQTLSTSAAGAISKTSTKQWSADMNYAIGANQRIRLDYIVSRTSNNVPFTMKVQLSENVAFWCTKAVNGASFTFYEIVYLLGGQTNCIGNVCTITGMFKGLQGVSDNISYRYCAVGVPC